MVLIAAILIFCCIPALRGWGAATFAGSAGSVGAKEVEKDEFGEERTGDPGGVTVIICCDETVPPYCSGI